jgi:hypothetical protein
MRKGWEERIGAFGENLEGIGYPFERKPFQRDTSKGGPFEGLGSKTFTMRQNKESRGRGGADIAD